MKLQTNKLLMGYFRVWEAKEPTMSVHKSMRLSYKYNKKAALKYEIPVHICRSQPDCVDH